MSETTKPVELLDLVEAHLHKEFKHWLQGLGIYKTSFGHMVVIWGRDAGILLNNKWYSWTEIKKPVRITHASDPSFFNVIVQDVNKAFCRSGEDVRWLRPLPTK